MEDLLLGKGISDLAETARSRTQNARTSDSSLGNNLPYVVDPAVLEHLLPSTSVRAVDVESLMPCTPQQEAMLAKSAEGFYNVEMLFEVHSLGAFDISRLRGAWHRVIKHHSMLRTIFVCSTERQEQHDQVLLKNFDPSLFEVTEEQSLSLRSSIATSSPFRSNKLPHRLTVQRQKGGKTFMKLEISHAVTDAVSLGNVVRDLGLAYDSHLPTQSPWQFVQYQTQLWRQAETDLAYWQQYCKELFPCNIPRSARTSPQQPRLLHQTVTQPNPDIAFEFCQRKGVSMAHLFHAVWALVLKIHSDSTTDEVVFGYLVSGRDVEIEGIENIVGPLVVTLISRHGIQSSMPLSHLLTEVRDDVVKGSSKKYCDLSRLEREHSPDKRLFNTMINFRYVPSLPFPSFYP